MWGWPVAFTQPQLRATLGSTLPAECLVHFLLSQGSYLMACSTLVPHSISFTSQHWMWRYCSATLFPSHFTFWLKKTLFWQAWYIASDFWLPAVLYWKFFFLFNKIWHILWSHSENFRCWSCDCFLFVYEAVSQIHLYNHSSGFRGGGDNARSVFIWPPHLPRPVAHQQICLAQSPQDFLQEE